MAKLRRKPSPKSFLSAVVIEPGISSSFMGQIDYLCHNLSSLVLSIYLVYLHVVILCRTGYP